MNSTMSPPIHTPVMVNEVIEGLQPRVGGYFVDCTLGLGGHAQAILEKISPSGKLLGVDADSEAIKVAQSNLYHYSEEITLVNDNFANLETICKTHDFYPVDGILFDLGVSSMQLDTAQRGFSFRREALLDMRFDPMQELTASDIVNTFPERELASIIKQYGEERHAQRIARHIVHSRPITSTLRLAHIVEQVLGGKRRRIHPATRTFMALRIAVNRELDNLKLALEQTVTLLRPQGRLVVISYHSLEDRIVKEFMRSKASDRDLKLISRKVIRPTSLETESNPRSRSAKLRIAEHSS
ncbi:MAG: 16S rRNA (cytosine(1402)-N(4))-methyltransferase RsmH [Chloroflexota bacterium]|nr:16S rRNA (cytosine(1402)-N(4))-methyltransferase RsmH [Chloroflexota bacterium]